MSVRALPLPRVPRRHCRWCELPITLGRPDRSWHDGREEEPDCLREFQLHTRLDVQYPFVAKRDGEACYRCGEVQIKVVASKCTTYIHGFYDWRDYSIKGAPVVARCEGPYCEVEFKLALELEHTVPLWAVAHLTPAERRKYFGPWNLRLLGPCCHKPKTKAEAKQRAHVLRLAKATAGEKPKPRRKIQSGGFQTKLRRKMNGKVETR